VPPASQQVAAEDGNRVIANGHHVREPVAYLYRVAFRVAASDLKRDAATETLGPNEPLFAENNAARDVWSSLEALTPDQRAVVYLFYRADLTQARSRREVATFPPTPVCVQRRVAPRPYGVARGSGSPYTRE
jgi:hypothetical protein